jgi:hypothetical protein
METTNNELPLETQRFFNELSSYIGCKLYFYGSVQRFDYFPDDSDIDIDIFSDNTTSTLCKLKTFLKLNPNKIKRVIMYLEGLFITGYKFTYRNDSLKLKCEISLYSNKYKNLVLKEHLKKTALPYYALCLMIVLKFMYYKLKMFTFKEYKATKHYILSTFIGYYETPFAVLS